MTHDTQLASAQDWFAQGAAHAARGELGDALGCFEKARAMRPADAGIHSRLGAVLAALNRFPEALVCYRQASALEPDDADIFHSLGWVLEQMHRLDEAVLCYRDAVRLNPKADGSHNNMANCLQALGRLAQAHAAYRHAIGAAPGVPLYYRNFVQSKQLAADDPCFIAMEQLVRRIDSLTPDDQAQLHFAFGQALSDVGQNDRSFAHFLKANALYRGSVRYDEAATLGLFARLPELLTADLLEAKRGIGEPSDSPVFIVGMPRSGSTLIEQILASHPQVFGAGELTDFGKALVDCMERDAHDVRKIDLEALAALSSVQLVPLGADYLHRVRATLPASQAYRRITDKYLYNFINLGLIHLALPKARFIHCRRGPVETCLSIFSRIFHDVPFGYDLGELGRYYRAYDTLMTHWRRALPEGVMIEVQYETLVDDIEGEVRRMLAHCGLDWNARCLAFHRTRRQVDTASASQVRQPLFRTSLARWRPAPALLQPLYEGLGPELAGLAHAPAESIDSGSAR